MKKMLRLALGVLAIFVLGSTSLNSALGASLNTAASAGTVQPDDGGAGDYGIMN